jgi:hypothetical protein
MKMKNYLAMQIFVIIVFQFSVADKAVDALTAVNGTEYTIGCIPCVLCKKKLSSSKSTLKRQCLKNYKDI